MSTPTSSSPWVGQLPIAPTAVNLDDSSDYICSGTSRFFTVKRNRITILTSDGDRGRLPRRSTYERVYADPGEYKEGDREKMERDLRQIALWRGKIGETVAAIMFGRKNREGQPKWELAAWPLGYTFWVSPKPDIKKVDGIRRDYYLYGSPVSARFCSGEEFAYHAVWLMRGKPFNMDGRPDCWCEHCSGRKQSLIHKELEDIVKECDGKGGSGERPSDSAAAD